MAVSFKRLSEIPICYNVLFQLIDGTVIWWSFLYYDNSDCFWEHVIDYSVDKDVSFVLNCTLGNLFSREALILRWVPGSMITWDRLTWLIFNGERKW